MAYNDYERTVNGVYYVDVWGYHHKDYVNIVEMVKKRKIYKIVFLMPNEYYFGPFFQERQSFDIFLGFCKHYRVEISCLIGCDISEEYGSRYQLKDFKNVFISWNTWFAHQVILHSVDQNIDPYGIGMNPQKHFVSMNGRAHPHRQMFLDYMCKEDLFKHGYVSFHNFEQVPYDSYQFKWWSPVPMKFDEDYENTSDGIKDYLIPPQQFKKSVFSVICESTVDVQFITEKTYIPIYHRRPFVIYGPPRVHAYLKSLGFELFEEFIDYSFDTVEDDEVRCAMFMQQIKKLVSYDIQELREKTKKKIHHNWLNMLSIVENKKNIKRISKLLPKNTNHFNINNHLEFLNISSTEMYKKKINFLREHYENIINRK